MNFLFDCQDPVWIKDYHAAGMGPSMLNVENTFFCGTHPKVLCPDYEAKWATLYSTWVKPMLADGSLFGIFFG